MDQAIKITSELIKRRSVTPNDDGTIDFLRNFLSDNDYACYEIVDNNVRNLFARWGPKNSKKSLGFNGHLDVVPAGNIDLWDFDPFSGVISENYLHGRGAVDMKSAVAAFSVAAVEYTKRHQPNGSLVITLTSDEEGDALYGTKSILKWMKKNGETVNHFIVGEPTSQEILGDMIKVGRRGSLTAFLECDGIQGHSAYPHLAVNPIESINELIHNLLKNKLDNGSEYFEPSTICCTTIDVGNSANNVIPSKCSATLNIRFNNLHTSSSIISLLNQHIKDIKKSHGSKINMKVKVSGEAFINGDTHFTRTVADVIKKSLKISPVLSTSGGTSDARFIKDVAEVLEVGLVGKTIHQSNEKVALKDIVSLKNLYKAIITRYFCED